MFSSKEWVINLFNKLLNKTIINQQDNDYKNIFFKFGIDDEGNYGYIKNNESIVTPFRKETFGSKVTIIDKDHPSQSFSLTDGTNTITDTFSEDGEATILLPNENTWTVTSGETTASIGPFTFIYSIVISLVNLFYQGIYHADAKTSGNVSLSGNNVLIYSKGAKLFSSIYQLVDLSGFSKLNVTIVSGSVESHLAIATVAKGLTAFSSSTSQYVTSGNFVAYTSAALSTGTTSLDVSSYSGQYYVGFIVGNTSNTSSARTVSRIWLS